MKTYNKLVRDRIPALIEADGNRCTVRTLDDSAYLAALEEKLSEELAEYRASGELEELADLLEVLRAVVRARGWSWAQLEAVRAEKAARRGGFAEKLFLETVWEAEG